MMKFPWLMMISLVTVMVAHGETRVRISGISGRSEGQVLESMGGRLDHIRGSAATPASATIQGDPVWQRVDRGSPAGAPR